MGSHGDHRSIVASAILRRCELRWVAAESLEEKSSGLAAFRAGRRLWPTTPGRSRLMISRSTTARNCSPKPLMWRSCTPACSWYRKDPMSARAARGSVMSDRGFPVRRSGTPRTVPRRDERLAVSDRSAGVLSSACRCPRARCSSRCSARSRGSWTMATGHGPSRRGGSPVGVVGCGSDVAACGCRRTSPLPTSGVRRVLAGRRAPSRLWSTRR